MVDSCMGWVLWYVDGVVRGLVQGLAAQIRLVTHFLLSYDLVLPYHAVGVAASLGLGVLFDRSRSRCPAAVAFLVKCTAGWRLVHI